MSKISLSFTDIVTFSSSKAFNIPSIFFELSNFLYRDTSTFLPIYLSICLSADDGHLDEAAVRQEDRHRIDVDRAESRVEIQSLTGADGLDEGLQGGGRPDARALGVDQAQGLVDADRGDEPAQHDGGGVERRDDRVRSMIFDTSNLTCK